MWTFHKAFALSVVLHLFGAIDCASAETADTILFNGKIVTVDNDFSVREALAIAHGQVLASGTSAAMKKLADDKTRLVDLGGRTVIPGLTDGHIHGVRAALTFGTEVNWIGVPTLKQALDKIRETATTRKPGSWIVVAGGWTEEQFAEKRRPTPREVFEAAQRSSSASLALPSGAISPSVQSAQIRISPGPLKCSIESPKPCGNSCVRFCRSASSLPGFGAQR